MFVPLPPVGSGSEPSGTATAAGDPCAIDPAPFDSASILGPLVPLFAPYCDGVSKRQALEAAVGQLLHGEWTGERRLESGQARPFSLRWQGELAPLESLRCALTFPDLPSVHYDFTLPAYRLVQWLMQREQRQLPVSFWRWLLLGEAGGAAGTGVAPGTPAAVA
ncbi:MAG: type IV pilus biogenesis protein EbsA [Cyanobacteria bacterium J06638_7]